MDTNGTRFLQLHGPDAFRCLGKACAWDGRAQAFTLTRQDTPRIPELAPAKALALGALATPHVIDDHGQIGRLSRDRTALEYVPDWPGTTWEGIPGTPIEAPPGTTFRDVTLGGSGLVALPYSDGAQRHGVKVFHLRKRWQMDCSLSFPPIRAWVDGEDRAWVAGEGHLALCQGHPLPQPYAPRPDRFEPVEVEPEPFTERWVQKLPPIHQVMGLHGNGEGVVLLARLDDSHKQWLLWRTADPRPEVPIIPIPVPPGMPMATDLAYMPHQRVLLLCPMAPRATRHPRQDCPLLALDLGDDPRATLVPERWPRHSEHSVRFLRHRDGQPRHLSKIGPLRLFPLPQARYLPEGRAALARPLDSLDEDTLWHRMYLEARVPEGCAIQVEAQAHNELSPMDADAGWERQPAPLWLPLTSEIPFAPSLAASVPGHEGLFEILLQRSLGPVRDLRGRYLSLRFTLQGDGRHTPAIHRIRVWHPRFSWQETWFPEHFHQEAPPLATPFDPGTGEGEANGADVRGRVLASLEGFITPVEERIAAAEALLMPMATPAPFLPWLASFLGVQLPGSWPEMRQRRWLAGQGRLQPLRGTFGALLNVLDLVTDGGVRRGQVVPVELFRMRRTFATILGLDLDDGDHPLTLGTGRNGNSRVGDTLVLSGQGKAFLALLAPELARTQGDQAAVDRFFDDHARRLTILLHGPAQTHRRVLEAVLPAWIPACVRWDLLETDHPFVLGLAPLLGIHTYLEPEPEPAPVRLAHTRLGRGDLIHNPVALAPVAAVPHLRKES